MTNKKVIKCALCFCHKDKLRGLDIIMCCDKCNPQSKHSYSTDSGCLNCWS